MASPSGSPAVPTPCPVVLNRSIFSQAPFPAKGRKKIPEDMLLEFLKDALAVHDGMPLPPVERDIVADGFLIQGKYRLGRKFYKRLYRAVDMTTGVTVAIKNENPSKESKLISEAEWYKLFDSEGFPSHIWSGEEGDYRLLITEYVGPNLLQLMEYCGSRFSLKTVCMLAPSMIRRVQYIHMQKCLHRNMKPDNFCMGLREEAGLCYCLDFGDSVFFEQGGVLSPWRDHIPLAEIRGNRRYLGQKVHSGEEHCRGSEMEALGHVIIFMIKGELPWMRFPDQPSVVACKCGTSVEDLCVDLPEELASYMTYCRGLGFEDEPDYDYLVHLFETIMHKNGWVADGEYDWITKFRKEAMMVGEQQQQQELKMQQEQVLLGQAELLERQNSRDYQ